MSAREAPTACITPISLARARTDADIAWVMFTAASTQMLGEPERDIAACTTLRQIASACQEK